MVRSLPGGWRRHAALFVCLGVALLLGHADAAPAARPNFVVIQTDDQNAATVRAKFRALDGSYRPVMPNTVRLLLNRGTEFTNHYASSPVCSPSRASLLSGQYPWNNGVLANEGPNGGWTGWQRHDIIEHNLPVTLASAGYRTAHFGKFTNSYFDEVNDRVDTTVPPGWSRWFTTAYMPGTRFYGYRLNVDGRPVGPVGNPGYRAEGRGTDPAGCDVRRLDRIWPAGPCHYLTDVMTAAAVREIRQEKQRPFYIQVDYQAPHGDVAAPRGPQPASRHLGTAARTPVPRQPSFNEADFSDKPPVIRNAAPRRMGSTEISALGRSYRSYIESLRAVDDGIGAIFQALEQSGRLSNTYVILTSDHGMFLGEHRFDWGKFLPYEDSSSVMTAVRGPGVSRGARSGELTANIDIPVTVMDLAGAKPDYPVDGRSMEPFWRNPSRKTNRPVAIAIDSRQTRANASISARAPALRYRGFRIGRYKYIRYDDGGEELYDLARDPDEMNNRFRSPAYSGVLAYMRENLGLVTGCAATTCREGLKAPPGPG
ncbi:MAG: sulfatase [Solirubrobacterales bacterium]|nr:sulfatase [Solirubrobacterales bacterium]HMT04328.1 sulfatase [Solirubrobacterales bacterium]